MKMNAKRTYFLVSTSCLLLTVVSLLLSRGEAWSKLLVENGYLYIGDFLMHLQFVDNPQNVYFAYEGCCFPPLAYVFFLFVNRILPSNGAPDMNFYRGIPIAVIMIFAGMMLCMMILAWMIREYNGDRKLQNIGLLVLILFSAPFLCDAIERGNTVLHTLVFLVLALYLKDAENKAAKECALVLIAVAASFKIYPAVFGLLYVKEKRYKEAIRLAIYGILFFFVPFLFFGGFAGFLQFLHNLTAVQSKITVNICTITGLVEFLYAKMCMGSVAPVTVDMIPVGVHLTGEILSMVYLVLVCVLVFWEKKQWKVMLYLSSLMIIFTNSSFSYTTIYMLIPFLFFLKDEGEKQSREGVINAVLFGLIFTICNLPGAWFEGFFGESIGRLIRYPAIYVMLLYGVIGSLTGIYRAKKKGEKNVC